MCAILYRIAGLAMASLHCRRLTNQRNPAKVKLMEQYRPSLRRRLASVRESLRKLLSRLRPQIHEVRLQRMCPFCGLITPRAKRVCLECGKSISTVSLERKEAQQG